MEHSSKGNCEDNNCSLTSILMFYCRYHYLTGSQEALINYVISLDRGKVFDYENRYMKTELRVARENVIHTVDSHNFTEVCNTIPAAERMDWNFPWFRVSKFCHVFKLGICA